MRSQTGTCCTWVLFDLYISKSTAHKRTSASVPGTFTWSGNAFSKMENNNRLRLSSGVRPVVCVKVKSSATSLLIAILFCYSIATSRSSRFITPVSFSLRKLYSQAPTRRCHGVNKYCIPRVMARDRWSLQVVHQDLVRSFCRASSSEPLG